MIKIVGAPHAHIINQHFGFKNVANIQKHNINDVCKFATALG